MAKQLKMDEDNLKRRARRRLIGAIAVITVIVVVLPMLLDSEPQLAGNDIEIRIPDMDRVGEFEPEAPAALLPQETHVSLAEASGVVTEAASTVAATAVIPQSAPAPGKPPVPLENFVVQIGVFGNADSAHRLQKKLSGQGFKVYTEKIGDKTRVRAGPYATRGAADAVKSKLEKQGLKPVIRLLEE